VRRQDGKPREGLVQLLHGLSRDEEAAAAGIAFVCFVPALVFQGFLKVAFRPV
jgi:hypothetical protein